MENNFSNNLKKLMFQKNTSVSELAAKSGISQNIINGILKRQVRRVRIYIIIQLAQALNTSIDSLIM